MRDLTQQEIDNAPDWATHYYITPSGTITFESDKMFQSVSGTVHSNVVTGISKRCRSIPRKAFDIRYHDWGDEFIVIVDCDSEHFQLMCTVQNELFGIHRKDIITMAKHVNLTADELK